MFPIRAWAYLLSLGSSLSYTLAQDSHHYDRLVLLDLPIPGWGPCDMDTGPDGETIYYVDPASNRLGVVSTRTHNIVDYPIPYTQSDNYTYPFGGTRPIQCALRTGKDGNIYFTPNVDTKFYRFNPKTKQFREFEVYAPGHGPELVDMWTTETGVRNKPITLPFNYLSRFVNELYCRKVYFTRSYADDILFFDYGEYKQTTYFASEFSGPYGVRTDHKGFVYYTTIFNDAIVRIDPRTGTQTEFPLPQPDGQLPSAMRTLTEGRYLWANAMRYGGLIRFDTVTKNRTVFIYPYQSTELYPEQNAGDSLGNVWVSSQQMNLLAYLNPNTSRWTTIHLPDGTPIKSDRDQPTIAVHYGPRDAMWFSSPNTGQIGYYKL